MTLKRIFRGAGAPEEMTFIVTDSGALSGELRAFGNAPPPRLSDPRLSLSSLAGVFNKLVAVSYF